MVNTQPVSSRQADRTIPSPFRRTVACLILGLLCFQLSRVYIVVPADAFICAAPEHDHGGAALSHDDHDHGDVVLEALLADPHDGHTYITHCKDTLDGLGLTPAQPFQTPLAQELPPPGKVAVVQPGEAMSPRDNTLPPPFQPPRFPN